MVQYLSTFCQLFASKLNLPTVHLKHFLQVFKKPYSQKAILKKQMLIFFQLELAWLFPVVFSITKLSKTPKYSPANNVEK